MQALLDVILPVFLLIAAGYLAVWLGWFSDDSVDGLMAFTQTFAIPCLLFRAMWTLDLSANFDITLLLSYYTGSVCCFAVGLLGARYVFGRDWEDAVVIGFCGMFANSVMTGLAITERAYGQDALQANYVIVAFHAPFCYALGITAIEIVRAQGTPMRKLPLKVGKAISRNALFIGISLGLAVNFSGVQLPQFTADGLDMMVRAALPVALFATGGVLRRYKPQGDGRVIAFICVITLGMHPAITWTLGMANDLSREAFRSAVVTAAMAPGINVYVFANMYGRARRVAASSVLIATALSVVTAWLWLTILP